MKLEDQVNRIAIASVLFALSGCMADFGGEEFQQTRRAVTPTNNTPAGQYTPGPADWTTFQSKPMGVSIITSHDPDGIGWISNWPTWDGTIYDPSTMSRADFTAAICPSGDTIRGIREVFYQHNPFADNTNPTKAEVDEWHRIAINHVRALVGYTSPERQVKKDHCTSARALWGQQRKFTTMWDTKYPNGHCQGSTNPHCGATFIPTDPADQAPYLPPGHAPCTLIPGSEGTSSAPKSNIPWSIKWSRAFCQYLGAEGFWGGHVGPFFHREKFGFSFWDPDPSNNGNNAPFRGKWTGAGMSSWYCDPNDPQSTCEPPGASCPEGALDFSTLTLQSYSNQDAGGSATVEDGGETLRMSGNTWKRSAATFNITPQTVLEFEFASTSQGEIHAIGFDEDQTLENAPRHFQFWGTQNWTGTGKIDLSPKYTGGGDFQTFTIPVGELYTGTMNLVFTNDKDSGPRNNESVFRCVRVVSE